MEWELLRSENSTSLPPSPLLFPCHLYLWNRIFLNWCVTDNLPPASALVCWDYPLISQLISSRLQFCKFKVSMLLPISITFEMLLWQCKRGFHIYVEQIPSKLPTQWTVKTWKSSYKYLCTGKFCSEFAIPIISF